MCTLSAWNASGCLQWRATGQAHAAAASGGLLLSGGGTIWSSQSPLLLPRWAGCLTVVSASSSAPARNNCFQCVCSLLWVRRLTHSFDSARSDLLYIHIIHLRVSHGPYTAMRNTHTPELTGQTSSLVHINSARLPCCVTHAVVTGQQF